MFYTADQSFHLKAPKPQVVWNYDEFFFDCISLSFLSFLRCSSAHIVITEILQNLLCCLLSMFLTTDTMIITCSKAQIYFIKADNLLPYSLSTCQFSASYSSPEDSQMQIALYAHFHSSVRNLAKFNERASERKREPVNKRKILSANQ